MPVKYNIISPRDARNQNQERFDYKLDRRQPIRAVITDEFGNDSGSGDIWYDQSKRRVWIRELGTSSASIVFCYTLTPVIGLGVLVGWRPYSNIKEVLSSDIEFLGQTNATGTSYESPSNLDFLPGGRLQLWLQTKLIQPLATYPNTSGLIVNVVGGDYIYNGVRTTFAGQTNIDLSASQPTAGNYVFVGLYLDSSNTLQTVTGASGATTPPAEPAWPDGAFRLSVVRLYNPQTKVNLKLDNDADNDIFDRRIIWTDVDSFDIWPYDKIITVSQTNAFAKYSTIQDANDNETGPAAVLIDPAVAAYTETLTLSTGSMGYTGLGSQFEVEITSASATTITVSSTFIALRYMTIRNTNAGATATCVATDQDNTLLEFVRILKTSGAATTAVGLHINGSDDTGTTLRDSTILMAAGTTNYGVLMDTSNAFLLIDGGIIEADTFDVRLNNANAILTIQNQPQFRGNGIQVAAGQIICDETLATTITGPYSPGTGGSLTGKNTAESIITANQNTTDVTLTPSVSNLAFSNWTISNTGAGGGGISHTVVGNAQSGLVLDSCSIVKTTGASTTALGLSQSAGDTLARNCKFSVSAGTSASYAIYLHTAGSTVVVEGGEITAGLIVTAHASAVVELRGVKLASGVTFDTSGGGTIYGYYFDSAGNLIELNRVYQSLWYDQSLIDTANASGIASHFRDNDSSYPAGWTESDAALITNTNQKYSFWYLNGNSAETSWKYRIQTSINLESTTANDWVCFMFGPVLFRDADYSADLTYRLGMYRNNAGAIDENTYCRIKFVWNSSSSIWQMQAEERDGTTAHTGTLITMNQDPLAQPFYVRFVVRNIAAKNARVYIGTTQVADTHQQLINQAPTSAPTWGQVWLQIHQSRGAGVEDYMYIGAVDYLANTP